MSPLYVCRDLVQRYEGREVLRLPELTVDEAKCWPLPGPTAAANPRCCGCWPFWSIPLPACCVMRAERNRGRR